jgi:hypothetical protein
LKLKVELRSFIIRTMNHGEVLMIRLTLHNIKDPFAQARNNKYQLIDELLKLREFSSFNKDSIQNVLSIGYGVIFPDADRIVGTMLPEAHQNIYFTSHNLHSLDKEMKKLALYYAQGKSCSPAIALAAHNALKARLAPHFISNDHLLYGSTMKNAG